MEINLCRSWLPRPSTLNHQTTNYIMSHNSLYKISANKFNKDLVVKITKFHNYVSSNLVKAGASEHAGGGDGVDAITSGSNHGSEAGGREESGGGSGGDGGGGGGGEGRGDPEHGATIPNFSYL